MCREIKYASALREFAVGETLGILAHKVRPLVERADEETGDDIIKWFLIFVNRSCREVCASLSIFFSDAQTCSFPLSVSLLSFLIRVHTLIISESLFPLCLSTFLANVCTCSSTVLISFPSQCLSTFLFYAHTRSFTVMNLFSLSVSLCFPC